MRKERIERASLYSEVTNRIIAELEEGRLPWVQPWDSAACGCTMPQNAGTARKYSGINVLILWAEVVRRGYASQRWLTYRQAEAAGGNVRRGEKGTVICYADRFTPKAEAEAARTKRFKKATCRASRSSPRAASASAFGVKRSA